MDLHFSPHLVFHCLFVALQCLGTITPRPWLSTSAIEINDNRECKNISKEKGHFD